MVVIWDIDVGAAIKRQQALLDTLNGLSNQLSDAIKDTVRTSASFRTDQDTFREKNRVKVVVRNTELYKDTDFRTLGYLDKSDLHGVVYARSGMKFREGRNLINSGVYTTLALSIMRETEFPINGHSFDKLGRGSFYACHVEAQLIAYFIKTLQATEAKKKKSSIKEGHTTNLQADQRRARICVNRSPCRNCQDFRDHCERVFDVTVALVDMDVFPEPALTL